MPLDIDVVVAKQYIEKLEKILGKQPHMGRKEICDDIIKFANKMEEKYGK